MVWVWPLSVADTTVCTVLCTVNALTSNLPLEAPFCIVNETGTPKVELDAEIATTVETEAAAAKLIVHLVVDLDLI